MPTKLATISFQYIGKTDVLMWANWVEPTPSWCYPVNWLMLWLRRQEARIYPTFVRFLIIHIIWCVHFIHKLLKYTYEAFFQDFLNDDIPGLQWCFNRRVLFQGNPSVQPRHIIRASYRPQGHRRRHSNIRPAPWPRGLGPTPRLPTSKVKSCFYSHFLFLLGWIFPFPWVNDQNIWLDDDNNGRASAVT